MRFPTNAEHLGAYGDYDLFYAFKPQARYSARVMAYLYARSKQHVDRGFVQVASVRQEITAGLTAEEVERRLAVDVISRAKIRIHEHGFEDGEIYTVELDSLSMQRARAA